MKLIGFVTDQFVVPLVGVTAITFGGGFIEIALFAPSELAVPGAESVRIALLPTAS
jgi:hypothetical protein